jgi:hypothetical protein
MVDEHDPLANAVDIATSVALCYASESRYLFCQCTYRKGDSETRFQTDLKEEASVNSNSSGEDIIQPWLNDDEFLHKYRMTRASFKFLLDQIKDHPAFHTAKKRKQAPVEHQLMTWLKYVGTEGAGGSNRNQRNTFRIGYGSGDKYRERVTKAIRDLSPKFNTFTGRTRKSGRRCH